MGYAIEGIAYVGGTMLIGAGLYLVMRRNFPAWWPQRLMWPLVHLTPAVSFLQGLAALGLGASIIAIVFTTVVPDVAGGVLVLFALAAYLIGLVLFLFSTWLSRRPTA